MEKQIHFKCTLHRESPGPGKYREIEVVEHYNHFELLIFEGELLRSDQSTSAQPYFGKGQLPSNAGCRTRRCWGGDAKECRSRLDTCTVGGALDTALLFAPCFTAPIGPLASVKPYRLWSLFHYRPRSIFRSMGSYPRRERAEQKARERALARLSVMWCAHIRRAVPLPRRPRSSARLATNGIRRAGGAWSREDFSSPCVP